MAGQKGYSKKPWMGPEADMLVTLLAEIVVATAIKNNDRENSQEVNDGRTTGNTGIGDHTGIAG